MSAHLQAAPGMALLVIDDVHDVRRASDGFSRFGAYLAMRLPAVIDDDPDVLTDAVRWAAFAWATATTPVMSPGYLEWNGPIEDIQICWDDGCLAVEAILRTPPPVQIPGWRGWDRDRDGNHVEPWYGTRTALTRLSLRAILGDLRLPGPPRESSSWEDIVFTGKAAVRAVALAVEDVLDPVAVALTRHNERNPIHGVGR